MRAVRDTCPDAISFFLEGTGTVACPAPTVMAALSSGPGPPPAGGIGEDISKVGGRIPELVRWSKLASLNTNDANHKSRFNLIFFPLSNCSFSKCSCAFFLAVKRTKKGYAINGSLEFGNEIEKKLRNRVPELGMASDNNWVEKRMKAVNSCLRENYSSRTRNNWQI